MTSQDRLALEKAPAGSTFHGVGDTGIPRRVIAETIAGKLGIPAASVPDITARLCTMTLDESANGWRNSNKACKSSL